MEQRLHDYSNIKYTYFSIKDDGDDYLEELCQIILENYIWDRKEENLDGYFNRKITVIS